MENNNFKEFSTHKVDGLSLEILYIDMDEQLPLAEQDGQPLTRNPDSDSEEWSGVIGPKMLTKQIDLIDFDSSVNLKSLAAQMLESVLVSPTSNLTIDVSSFPPNMSESEINDMVCKNVWTRCNNGSYHIATNGRIGIATSIIANANTAAAYNLDAFVNREDNEMTLVVNEYVPDGRIFLIRNGAENEPGYKLFYHETDGQMDAYALVQLGFFPYRQAFRIDVTLINK